MSFSFLGGLASLLPGYMQGERQAVQDNWNDLMKYNQAQQGQLSNAFTEATWQPRLDMFWMNRHNTALNTAQNTWQTGLNYLALPHLQNQMLAQNYFSPQLVNLPYLGQMQAWNNAQQAQGMLGGAGGNGQLPSGVR